METITKLTDTFSSRAADLIKLFKWLQGPEFAMELMLRCYKLSSADKVSRATVERVLDEMTAEAIKADRAAS